MSFDVTVHVFDEEAMTHLAQLLGQLESVDYPIGEESQRAMEATIALAKYYCPIDTGNLMNSIRYEGMFPAYVLIADAKNKYGQGYAGYVEHGTSKQEAQPFMYPAIATTLQDFIANVQAAIRRWLK